LKTELRRQFVHGLGSLGAVILAFLGRDLMVAFILLAVACITIMASHRGRIESSFWKLFERFVKSHERQNEGPFMGAITFCIGALLAVVLFSQQVAMLAIIILAVGDSVSTLIGKLYGRHKLPYNKGKSWEGSTAFLISTLIIFMFALDPIKAVEMALLMTVVESLPKLNDNITIPVAVGFALML